MATEDENQSAPRRARSAAGRVLMAVGALITAMAGIAMLAALVSLGSNPNLIGQGMLLALGLGAGPVLLGLGIWFLGRRLSGKGRR